MATTLAAKGAFPEDHELSLGTFGWAGLRPAIDTLLSDELEVVLVVGSRMNMQDSLFWHERFSRLKGLIQVDLSEISIGHHFPTHHPVVSDALCFLQFANAELESRSNAGAAMVHLP